MILKVKTWPGQSLLLHTWPRRSLQLHTWPRLSLQLYDQNNPYSCILDQDSLTDIGFYNFIPEPCSALSHPCNTASLFSGQNTWDRFHTVMWHGIKSYRFPLSSLNTWDRGFAQSRGMEAKTTGCLFSNLKAWDRGFWQSCGMEAGFPFQGVPHRCVARSKIAGFPFQA